MPSKSNHSHAARSVARAGFLAQPNPDKSDLPTRPAYCADVVDDLADLDLDDPCFLVVDARHHPRRDSRASR